MILLIDEDWSKADPVALRAAGYTGVIGYVSEDTSGKNITRDQVAAAHAAGLDVGLVYEYAQDAAALGADRGTRDAAVAVAGALALGAPADVCLYAAVDFGATGAQLPAVLAYLKAFQAYARRAGFRAGAYGGYFTCQYLAMSGYTGLLWQTYAWSNGLWWPWAVLRQTQNSITVAGATVDRDEAEAPDWGQWAPPIREVPKMIAILQITRADGSTPAGPADGLGGFWHVPDIDALAALEQATGLKVFPVTEDMAKRAFNINLDAAPPAAPITLTDVDLDDIATLVVRKLTALFNQLAQAPTPAAPTA